MDPTQSFCPNMDCPARGHTGRGNIRIHCRRRKRYRCTQCGKTFSERRGTPFLHAHTQPETITLVLTPTALTPIALTLIALTLIAHGCPVVAIEAAFVAERSFGSQRRTVRGWIEKAGGHCRTVHEQLVLQPQVLHYVQADEIFSTTCRPTRSLSALRLTGMAGGSTSFRRSASRLGCGWADSSAKNAVRRRPERWPRWCAGRRSWGRFWSFATACAATEKPSGGPSGGPSAFPLGPDARGPRACWSSRSLFWSSRSLFSCSI